MQFRLRDFVYPLAIRRLRHRLAREERWSAEQIARDQLERLRALVEHARRSSPFWQSRLAAAGLGSGTIPGLDALARLPILTKDEVREHAEGIRARNPRRFAPRTVRTSGSTGTALTLLLDRPTNVLEFATLWRQFNWAGYRMGQRFADLRGHLVRQRSGIERDWRLNSLNLSAFDFTRERARAYARALCAFAPVMVRGYPSTIARFSAWVLEDGLELPTPRAVVTSSETLLAPQKELIERAFRAPVFDYYGQMERVAFAGQCERGAYHVAGSYGLVEILDADGNPCPPGVPGRLVATGLHHRAMPLLRYETRDLAVRREGPCACGREGALLASIVGRVEDFVLTPDGRHVGRLDAAFQHSPGIRLAQIRQHEVGSIQVLVVPGAGYGEEDERRLRLELRARLGERIAIEIEPVAELELSASGKLRFVVSTLAEAAPAPGIVYPQGGS